MRVATEMEFGVIPTDSLDFITEKVKDSLDKIRTVDPERHLAVKVFMDVEFQ